MRYNNWWAVGEGLGAIVMVGDGVSDLETMPVVDLFVGFGRYTARAPVRVAAGNFILSLNELLPLLKL